MRTRSKRCKSAGMILSVTLVMSLGIIPAYASEDTPESVSNDAIQAIEPRESWPNKEFHFNFKDEANCVSNNTGTKQDRTSFWIQCDNFGVDYCQLSADGYSGGWHNTTPAGFGKLKGTGQYELYNKVYEWYGYGTTCRLGGYRAGANQWWVEGWWTPDCEGGFDVLRS